MPGEYSGVDGGLCSFSSTLAILIAGTREASEKQHQKGNNAQVGSKYSTLDTN